MDNFEAEYDFITNDGSKFLFKTNKDAPNYKLITIDMDNFGEVNIPLFCWAVKNR